MNTIIGENAAVIDSLPNSNQLFAFGYQNERMRKVMETLGNRPVCADFTHNTNQYGFYLLNFVAVDEYGKGYPILYLICNIAEQPVITDLLGSLKNKYPNLSFPAFVTDDDPALYNSILDVFEPKDKTLRSGERIMKHLLCLWHIDENIRKNLRKKVKKHFVCSTVQHVH